MNEKYMKMAIKEAIKSKERGDVPVGCLIVKDGLIIAKGRNMREERKDSTLHAEIVAIKKACKKIEDWRLSDCEMYVTLEPCPMCAGAIVNSRISKLYFGAYDPVSGCAETVYPILNTDGFYHKTEVFGGIMESECKDMLVDFFKSRRKENKLNK